MYRLILTFASFFLLSRTSFAAPASPTSSGVPDPKSTACSDIVNDPDGNLVFNATLAYECLTSVPFNPAVATRFIEYYNDTLLFQSTLTYLKNPPASYQQPAVDLLQGLAQIQEGINSGAYLNEYEFEAALQTLIYEAHDTHLDLVAGVLAAFTFGSPYDIVSVSIDGKQLPKIYLAVDLFDSAYFQNYTPSAIKTINGQDTVEYLTAFAAKNSAGTLEPHADWNQLMLSPSLDIQAYFDVFSGGATFYPGDTITFGFENGTSLGPEPFIAIYNSPGDTGPLATGGDFYNFFVLGFYPASYDPYATSSAGPTATATATQSSAPTSTTASASATATPLSWDNPAYPLPDVAQPDLGTYGGGYVSGYFLNDTRTGVLSIPNFHVKGDDVLTFQDTVTEFLTRSKAAGMKKIVIDLQYNGGGQSLLAIDTFKQFFPQIDPFNGNRLRATNAANVMGTTITDYWASLALDDDNYYALAANEWVALDRLVADTNQNFTSWPEFFGPHAFDGDSFTTTQRYNLSSFIFDSEAVGGDVGFAVYGYDAYPANTTQPYAAGDIIVLTDSYCVSSCAFLVEMMHHEAGVQTVVAGGRPTTGPMQAASGSRGARGYHVTDVLDANIDFAQSILENSITSEVTFLPNRTEALTFSVSYAEVNLKDQVRKDEHVPLQFIYDAANCRIFYTPKTVYNQSALWQYAADAVWKDPTLCVQGSTGFATSNETNLVGPPYNPNAAANKTYSPSNTTSFLSVTGNDGLPDSSTSRNAASIVGSNCSPEGTCPNGFVCAPVLVCDAKGNAVTANRCQQGCIPSGNTCNPCQPFKATKKLVGSQSLSTGFCVPTQPDCRRSLKPVKIRPAPPP